MSKVLTNNAWIAGVVGLAFVLSFAFGFTTTKAEEDLEARIAELVAQIAELEAQLGDESAAPSTTAAGCETEFNSDLSMGDSGSEVMQLQVFLNEQVDGLEVASSGAGSPGNETEHFGSLTQAAVIDFQEKYASEVLAPHDLTSGTGYWGRTSRAKANELCEQVTVTPTEPSNDEPSNDEPSNDEPSNDEPSNDEPSNDEPETGLQGDEGMLDLNDLGLGAVDIELGDSDVIYEVEVEALDSDMEVNRVDFTFDERPWLYFDEVRLMMDGSEVAYLSDSGDYREVSGDYRARFSGLEEVIREGETVTVELEADVLSSMAGTRDQHDVEVDMVEDAFRFVDGAGIIGYSEGDDPTTVDVTFDSAFGDGSIDVTLGDDSPEEDYYMVDEDDRTTNQEILIFEVEAEDSDILVDNVHAQFDSSTSTIENMLRRARLYMDGDLVSSKSLAGLATTSAATLVFDDLDETIAQDDTAEFVVEVDFYETSRSGFDVPDTLEAQVVEIDAENEDYADAGDDTLSIGSDVVHDVVKEGLLASLVSDSSNSQSEGEAGRYIFDLSVTAHGNDFYLDEDGEQSFTATSTGPGTGTTSIDLLDSDATLTGENNYRIREGETRDVTVTVYLTDVDADGSYRTVLESMIYGTSDDAGTPNDVTEELGSPDFRSGSEWIDAPGA